MVFGLVTIDGDVKPPFIFLHNFRLNMEVNIKCLSEVMLPWIDEVEESTFDSRTLLHATQTEEARRACQKVSATTSPLTSGHLNSSDRNSLDYYGWWTVEQETNKTPFNTKYELKEKIMALFTNLNKETIGEACRRFQNRQEAVVESSGDFFE